jgi:hypothetical protein
MPTSVFYTVSDLLSNVHGNVLFTFSETGLTASGTNQNGTQIFSANVLPDGFEYIENDSGEQETFIIPKEFLEFFNEREALEEFIEIRYKSTDEEDVVTINGQEYATESLAGDIENHVGVNAQDSVGLKIHGAKLKEGVEWADKTGDVITLSYSAEDDEQTGVVKLSSLSENEIMSNGNSNRQQLISNNTGLAGTGRYGIPATQLNQIEDMDKIGNVYLDIDMVDKIVQNDTFQDSVVIGVSGAEEPVIFESMFTENNFRNINRTESTDSEVNDHVHEQDTANEEPGDIVVSLQSVVFPLKSDVIEN